MSGPLCRSHLPLLILGGKRRGSKLTSKWSKDCQVKAIKKLLGFTLPEKIPWFMKNWVTMKPICKPYSFTTHQCMAHQCGVLAQRKEHMGMYKVDQAEWIGLPETPRQIMVQFDFELNGQALFPSPGRWLTKYNSPGRWQNLRTIWGDTWSFPSISAKGGCIWRQSHQKKVECKCKCKSRSCQSKRKGTAGE